MSTLMITDLGVPAEKLTSILHYNGMPISARFIYREIVGRLRKPAAAQPFEAVS